MEAMTFTSVQIEELIAKIETLLEQLQKKTATPQQTFIDNKTFLQIMGVSQRTGQAWRDEGKVAFSQVGNKIYYKMEDIEKFLSEYHNKAFAK